MSMEPAFVHLGLFLCRHLPDGPDHHRPMRMTCDRIRDADRPRAFDDRSVGDAAYDGHLLKDG